MSPPGTEPASTGPADPGQPAGCAEQGAPPGGAVPPAGCALWAVALAVQLGSPLIVHPRGLFELRPAHLAERHSALLLVALAVVVLATVPVGAFAALEVQLIVLTVLLAGMLMLERRLEPVPPAAAPAPRMSGAAAG